MEMFWIRRIYGDRYKCLQCPDVSMQAATAERQILTFPINITQWDSCSACFKTVTAIHKAHNFVRMKNSDDLQLLAPYIPKMKHSRVLCDHCNRGVEG